MLWHILTKAAGPHMDKDVTVSLGNSAAADLTRLGELVTAHIGLHYPEGRQQDLLRAVRAIAREHGQENTEAYLQSLSVAPLTDRQMEILTAHLTVGETYFFREMKSLDAFRTHVIPELIRQRSGRDQRLRIWSAGCSTGEEAYTIAIILSELIPDLKAWDIDILATDINSSSLDKARQGSYTEWSFRGTSESLREKYFEPHGGKTFTILPRFKNMVTFECHNLATDSYPSLQNNTNAIDVIFCRNVMMYFIPELARKVIMRFRQSLVEDGWLIVAPSESSMLFSSDFVSVPFEGATLYRKACRKPVTAPDLIQMPHSNAECGKRNAEMNIGHSTSNLELSMKDMERQQLGGREFSMTKERQQSTDNGIESSKLRFPCSDFRVPTAAPYEEALAAYQAGLYDDAIAALQSLFSSDISAGSGIRTGKALALMARINANQGKLDLASEWAEKAIAADKVNPGFYYLLATILEEQHRATDAVQALKRALYLDSTFIMAHFALGNIALQKNGRNVADRHFLNAASLLAQMPKDEVLPESEGVTAGRLLEIIESMKHEEVAAP